ncbi:cytochrome c3 family protein [Sedimentitalea sp. HM32M-2]|uniref:cytochrome c3 family protein n=1 Tax=Sedimentitalea sp. HM32M-2 TaxID=3351566 RepID=UPI0036446C55
MQIAVLILLLLLGLPAMAQSLDGYLGSDSCSGCHKDSAAGWAGSHHAQAWTLPSRETVAGDFSGTDFHHDGVTARFQTGAEGGYYIELTEKDGSQAEYQVHSVAGIEPLQQYLLETGPGRLQSFDVAWDTEQEKWFHLYPDQDLPPSDGLHWTGPYKTWNARCAECHATGFSKGYDARRFSYASTQVEMGVGCEACHGPGADHVAWAEGWKTTRTPPPANHGFPVDFSDSVQTVEQCATCHSRRETNLDGNPAPGTRYDDAYVLALLRPGLYYADGQIQDEVYVYGSFLQSKMYARGVTCLNCHNAHSLELKAEGNGLCSQCHSPAGNPDFPTLSAADYDSPAHHFHPEGTTAAKCQSCHMPERVYMGNDWRADHSFRIPRPDLSQVTGAPDACTACHGDRDAAWAAAQISTWYPDSKNRGQHYGEVLARGRADAVATAGDLTALAQDTSQPGIVRATALWLLEQSNSPQAATGLTDQLQDPDPLVRAAAASLQRLAPLQERSKHLAAAFADPARNVRMAAARTMLGGAANYLQRETAAELQGAMVEWQDAMTSRLDFPETHLQLGGVALTMRDMGMATSAFREVVRLDPQRLDAWMMLVRITAATRGRDAAATVVAEALSANPEHPELLAVQAELDGKPALPTGQQ